MLAFILPVVWLSVAMVSDGVQVHCRLSAMNAITHQTFYSDMPG